MADEPVAIIDTPEAKKLIAKEHGKEQNIKMELVAMIQEAANPFHIIQHLAEYLEDVSAERGYAQHVLKNLRTIYGIALGDKQLLEDELSDIQTRIEKLKTAKADDGYTDEQKARMEFAIKAHERMAEKLKHNSSYN